MGKISRIIGQVTGLAQPRLPPARMEMITHTFRRRLIDGVEDIFQRACMMGDLTTAGELLAVMEALHERECAARRDDRRINDDAIQQAREELIRRQIMHMPPARR